MLRTIVLWAAARAAERTREKAAAMNLIVGCVGVCCVEEGEGRATTDEGETNFGRQTNNKQQVSYTGENVLALHYKFS